MNCSLFGIGERTGNTPLEAMVFEYAQLRGTLDGMDTTVITELADYYEKEIGYHIPSRTPFVGKNFNVTISNTSGLAGIAHWINTYFKLPEDKKVDKNSELVSSVKEWVDKQYEEGRVTVLTDDELIRVIDENCKRIGVELI